MTANDLKEVEDVIAESWRSGLMPTIRSFLEQFKQERQVLLDAVKAAREDACSSEKPLLMKRLDAAIEKAKEKA